jgi:hypothetical protein
MSWHGSIEAAQPGQDEFFFSSGSYHVIPRKSKTIHY